MYTLKKWGIFYISIWRLKMLTSGNLFEVSCCKQTHKNCSRLPKLKFKLSVIMTMGDVEMQSFKVYEVDFQFQLVSRAIRKDQIILEGRYERKITPRFPSNARVTPPMQYLSSTEPERAFENFQKTVGFLKASYTGFYVLLGKIWEK